MNDTIQYYNENAESFYSETVNADMSDLHECFLSWIPRGGNILDLGCGSGRDSLAFKNKGYKVTMAEPSLKLCHMASALVGQECFCVTAEEISWINTFDGIWACASLLHLGIPETEIVYNKIFDALKSEGILFVSYKYGTGERTKGGRFFKNMNETDFLNILSVQENFFLVSIWTTADVRPGRSDEKWFNALLKKK